MQAAEPRSTLLRRMAWLTLLLLLAVTCLSAFLRQSAAGLGCQPWPACFGQGERAAAGAVVVGGQALTVARAAHRVTATLALLLVMAMVVVSLARRPRLRREGALSLALLVLALLLALLGVFTPGSRLPAVAIGNLAGGFAIVAIASLLVRPAAPRRPAIRLAAIGVFLLLGAQIVSGAHVSASHAGLACTSIRECVEASRAAGWDWSALTPWREAAFAILSLLLIFGLVLLHELGHSLVAQRLGVAIRSITLMPLGGLALMDSIPRRPRDDRADAR